MKNRKTKPKPLTQKQQIERSKSRDEFANRLRSNRWTQPTTDWRFRLAALMHFNPENSTRQIFNRAQFLT